MTRECGGCTLCCKLLPQAELHKKGGVRCLHQKHGVGCTIYARRPASCMFWNCRWLVEDDTADQSRPDRCHYVIDIMPDFITIQPHDGSPPEHIECVQVWIDPHFPDAHKDRHLRAYLARRGEEGIVGLIRYGEAEGFVLIPPNMAPDGRWHEERGGIHDRQHTLADVERALGGQVSVHFEAEG